MLAKMANAPEFVLTEAQSKELAKAIDAVSGEYIQTIDPKSAAWINLIMVLGMTYGGAYMKMSDRKKKEKALSKQGSVTPINPGLAING
jgi:hypothetical protein